MPHICRRWVQSEIEELTRLFHAGKLFREISETLHRHPSSVKGKARTLGLRRMPYKWWRINELTFIKQNHWSLSDKELSEALKRSTQSIQKKKISLGIKGHSHLTRPDLTGRVYPHSKILKSVGRTRNGSVIWKIKCCCGNLYTRQTSSINQTERTGGRMSCGCLIGRSPKRQAG